MAVRRSPLSIEVLRLAIPLTAKTVRAEDVMSRPGRCHRCQNCGFDCRVSNKGSALARACQHRDRALAAENSVLSNNYCVFCGWHASCYLPCQETSRPFAAKPVNGREQVRSGAA